MVKRRINFVKGFYKTKSLPLNSQRLINMYAEPQPDDSRTPMAFFGCPGMVDLVTIPTYFTVYALEKMGQYLYAVVGNVLYQIDNTFTATAKGTLGTTPDKVRLSSNGYQLTILTSAGSSWVYNANTDAFAQITDVDYQLASDTTFIDSYTVFSKQSSGQFFNSDLNDSTSYDALNFQTAEWEPDNLIGIRRVASELWAFGETTIEIYQNTGGSPIFARVNGTQIKKGCLTRDSISTIDNNVFWLADDRCIYMATGYQYKKISTPAIDQLLETYSIIDLQNAISFGYEWQGHKFYVITFPDKEQTFQYDMMTDLWSERISLEGDNNQEKRWIANCAIRYNDYVVIGDYQTGKLYYLKDDVYIENGKPVFAEIITSPMFNNMIRTNVSAMYIDMETGVGATNGQGSNPKMIIQISDDGGRTYDNEQWLEIGELGKYRTIVKYTPMGMSDNFTVKIRISDPIKKAIYGGYIDYEDGIS